MLEQKGVARDDIEIIVADSSRDDELKHVLDAFRDERIKYHKTPNHDPSIGWDFAYKQSRGRYVLWFDDDDYGLPGSLKIFSDVIDRLHPDVITAQHVYFYDGSHPRRDRRGSLGVIPFDGKEYELDPHDILRHIFQYSLPGTGAAFRLRSGSTLFAREVCERAVSKLGFVVLPHMRTSHSLQAILFPFARTCIGISIPTVVVGRLGASLTQNFRKIQNKTPRPPFQFKESPVRGDLVKNHVAESFLTVQRLLPEEYRGIQFNMEEFLSHRYLHELFYSNVSATIARSLWKELRSAAEALPDAGARARVLREINRLARKLPFIQPLKSLGLWNFSKDTYQYIRLLFGKDIRKIPNKTSEYLISLREYHISDIQTLARRAREIILEKMGKDISLLDSANL